MNYVWSLVLYVLLISIPNLVYTLDFKKALLNPFKKNKTDLLGDLKKCRVSHSGVEYEGNIAETKSGILCQNWETPDPIHKVAEQIVDSDFPEGSKKKAKNYCRNPQHWSGRPWCYTLDFNITDEECNVPLCVKKNCRLTGSGIEYGGLTHSSGSRECLYWSDLRGVEYKNILYNSLFPDGTRIKAENKCRNPDSDPGGPWCFVQAEMKEGKTSSDYEKAYCGIPLCDPKPCMVATTEVSTGYQDYHTVFSLLPENTSSLEFSVKLWHPDQWHNAELKVALVSFPLPTTGSHMRSWKTGIEVVISTYKSGLTPKEGEESDWNVKPGLLSGTQWRDLELSWTGGFISLKVKGKAVSVFTKDFTGNEKELSKESFKFYSIKGSNALWNFPFCSFGYPYEELLTTHGDFERRWPLPKATSGFELEFFVRGFHTAIIELKVASMLQYPSIQLTLVNSLNANKTTLTIKESQDRERETLEEVKIESLLSYWEWREFSLIIDGPRLELYWISDSKPSKLLSAINSRIEFLKWFSVGSRHSTVHWAISCSPPKDKRKIPAELPECVMNEGEGEYSGKQSVSATGLTCMPWADSTGMISQNISDNNFEEGSKENAKNYCRNPVASVEGPYCFAADLSDTGFVINKQNCSPRKCRSKECRMAGTGNDYIGSLSVTIAGRTCQRWNTKTPHDIPSKLLNKEMFPELSISDVSNFCRNPTHDLAGPWCYTSDINLETDVCNVPDCDLLNSCTVIVKGNVTRQKIYIIPSWKTSGFLFKIKSWDPKWNEGVKFLIESSENNLYYVLNLGENNNDRISLHYINNEGKSKLLKQKTITRIIPSGHWASFVLGLGFGEVSIMYENVPTPFFNWKYTFSEGAEPFHPRFLSYSAINQFSVGLNFHCDECHTHITQPGLVENIYPLNWRSYEKQIQNNTVISLNIRGTGSFILVLVRLVEAIFSRILIEVSDYGLIVVKNRNSILAEFQNHKVFSNHSWTNFTISFTEEKLAVVVNNKTVIDYQSKVPLVFYFFSISVSDGMLTWNANCDPQNIDGPPVNGGWSSWGSWECSVTCGGGRGKRRRLCDQPKPNLIGEPCNGSDVMEGECNDFKCGDVPPELYKLMSARITQQSHNLRKWVGEKLLVECDQNILSELKDASPSTKVEWIKDGIPLSQQKISNISISNFSIVNEKASLNDTGIYICAIEDRKSQRAVVQLTSVTVLTNISTKFARQQSTIVLDCQANPLTTLFSELTHFWTLNGKLLKDYGATSHSLVDVDLLSPVTKEHAGDWECIVVQVQHNISWVTAWFRLKVKKNSILDIMFDKLFLGHYFRIFGNSVVLNSIFALLLLLVFVFIVSSIVFVTRSFKKGRNKNLYNKSKRSIGYSTLGRTNKDSKNLQSEQLKLIE